MTISALDVQNVIASASNNSTANAADAAREDAEQQKIEFLELLLTQLVNQNPLDPMDTDEWTAQLTRYSILEQGIDTNENLSVISSTLQNSSVADSLNYIGTRVEVETNINTVQDGLATWSYDIEGSADDVKLTFSLDDGTRIDEVEGSIVNGVQTFNFDAASYGIPDGTPVYLSINAADSDGNKLNSRTSSTMTVEGVWSDESGSYLTAGTLSFLTSDVLRLVEAPIPTVAQNQTQNNSTSQQDNSTN